jgi:hypothetical protein
MATISKANRPRKVAGMTRNGRPRLRARSIAQLEEMYSKASDKKSKGKILNELNRQRSRVK